MNKKYIDSYLILFEIGNRSGVIDYQTWSPNRNLFLFTGVIFDTNLMAEVLSRWNVFKSNGRSLHLF